MAKRKKLTFADALQELEDINELLTEDVRDIDLLVAKTKRAKELLDFCKQILRDGESVVRNVLDDNSE